MKVFFAASPRAVARFREEYTKIYTCIEKLGGTNLNDIPILNDPDSYYQLTDEALEESHITLSKNLRAADVVIIETTIHSLTMGYFMKMALDLDKPTILLHQPGSKPFYFSAIQNPRLQILEYTQESLQEVLKYALEYARENVDIRFNLFLSPELYAYLKWAAQKFETQRANFIRNLLLEHKKNHEEQYLADLKS